MWRPAGLAHAGSALMERPRDTVRPVGRALVGGTGGFISPAGSCGLMRVFMMERDLSITFAGGGNKSFYQFGLMRRWRDQLLPRVRVMTACSAGACVAALLLSGREGEVEEFWRRRSGGVTRNFEWRRLLRGRRPTPHGELYRDLLLHAFADGGFERVRAQPFPILILTTAFPGRMPSFAAAFLGLCAYGLDHGPKVKLRPPFAQRFGFSPLVFDARQCDTPEELADLIIATSATPPFTPVGRFRERRLLDGGIIDPAPAFLADDVPGVERSLVLLTAPRHGPSPEESGRRLYVAPATALPIRTWDFTRADLLEATIRRGERDAEFYGQRIADFIARTP
jgi:predicted acylesterase/phospholipase RssA